MKRILIFAHQCKPFHEPNREIASQRAYYLARYLPSTGWDCTVICALSSTDEAVHAHDDWRIIGVPARRLPPGRRLWQSLVASQSGRSVRRALSWWYSRRGDNGVVWARDAVNKALVLHRELPFDAVVGEHSPDGGVEAASLFFRMTGIPYSIDTRDPVGILFDADARRLAYFRDRCRKARLITTTTAAWIEPFEAAYGVPTWTVSHAYDHTEMAAIEPRKFGAPTLVYAGSTYEGQNWDPIGNAIASEKGALRFWSAGHGAHRIREAFERTGALEYSEISDPVPRDRSLAAQKGASSLLLVAHDSGCVSGRTFEHIGSGSPIIYFPGDGSEIEQRIRYSGARFRIVTTETQLAELFADLARGAAEWESHPVSSPITRVDQAHRFAQILEAMCFGAPFPSKIDFEFPAQAGLRSHSTA